MSRRMQPSLSNTTLPTVTIRFIMKLISGIPDTSKGRNNRQLGFKGVACCAWLLGLVGRIYLENCKYITQIREFLKFLV